MKLIIGKQDGSELVLAEQSGGVWKPNPNLSAEFGKFLEGVKAEELETWVEDEE